CCARSVSRGECRHIRRNEIDGAAERLKRSIRQLRPEPLTMTTSQESEPPVTIENLHWEPLTPAVSETWSTLTREVAAADGHDEISNPEDLLEVFEAPNFDAATQTLGAFDGDKLVGFI